MSVIAQHTFLEWISNWELLRSWK